MSKSPSLPSWECGLKYLIKNNNRFINSVAPFVGVWIEIREYIKMVVKTRVAPFVGVWIEIFCNLALDLFCLVAPFVGVWIEMNISRVIIEDNNVAPFVGVWIEISHTLIPAFFKQSLPSWECGLK